MFENILSAIKKYDKIIIHRHGKPDGDALGSQIGLKHIILENFPNKTVYAVGDSSRYTSIIDDCVMDIIPDSAFEGALSVILDSGARSMINDDRYALAEHTVRIDHHIFCEKIAGDEVIDTSFESCCGMIVAFADESSLKINSTAAQALFTGMVTDSGRFRYDNTNARTLRLAALLLDSGVDTSSVYRKLYADTYENKKNRALFTLKIKFTPNNAAYIYTTRDELAELNADIFTVSRGMVGVMADMKDVHAWVNFTEADEGIFCELRSDDLNINQIAVKYGGGGHLKASGATVPDYATAMAMLNDIDALCGGAN